MRRASWMGLKLMSYNEEDRNELKTRLRTRKSPGFISVNPVFGFRFIVCFFFLEERIVSCTLTVTFPLEKLF